MGGEVLHVSERIVLAPVTGRFVAGVDGGAGTVVEAGEPLASVVTSGEHREVRTPFSGVIAGRLAHDGERVREGQPLFWLRAAG